MAIEYVAVAADRQVLCNEAIVELLRQNFVCWGWDVTLGRCACALLCMCPVTGWNRSYDRFGGTQARVEKYISGA
jgi:hypothetical protein